MGRYFLKINLPFFVMLLLMRKKEKLFLQFFIVSTSIINMVNEIEVNYQLLGFKYLRHHYNLNTRNIEFAGVKHLQIKLSDVPLTRETFIQRNYNRRGSIFLTLHACVYRGNLRHRFSRYRDHYDRSMGNRGIISDPSRRALFCL